MYHRDLRELYWWPGLKREVIDFIARCLTCQQVKAEYQLPLGLLQPVKIPLLKWERTNSGSSESDSDRQKSYIDLKRCGIEYSVGDFVFLKVSPWKKVLRFSRKGKLSPRFIGLYRILKRVGPVACQLELLPELVRIHHVFHVSMLRRCRSDPSHVVLVEEIEIRPDLTFEEKQIQILDRDVKVLRRKSVSLVKCLLCVTGKLGRVIVIFLVNLLLMDAVNAD
ncbi:uncharacterized protein [Gossypium hirsutum]|uniref:DNA/RNA polymerases superfamily protein n=1 Tax=Gossypium hirsutum TaxID=3635 RepID=A0ABM3BWC6_GOSHI|nr:uncharacterized protein LOC121230521 [Gossypium hirsutum]